MSHFAVLVVGENIEDALQPYHEYECTGIKDKYVRFVSATEKKSMKEFEKQFMELKSGVEIKYRYESFDQFMEEYYGYEKHPTLGNWGRYTNPNAKWDWWVIGGRWTGKLKLKNGCRGSYGELGIPAGLHVNDGKAKETDFQKPGYCDSTLKKNIDIEGMETPLREKAIKCWNEWHEIFKHILDKKGQSKKEWITQNFGFLATKKEIEQLDTMTLEEYIACQSIWAPYALVWAGKWYGKGTMGWFGISFDEENKWRGIFKELWADIPDDELITMVDCHI